MCLFMKILLLPKGRTTSREAEQSYKRFFFLNPAFVRCCLRGRQLHLKQSSRQKVSLNPAFVS